MAKPIQTESETVSERKAKHREMREKVTTEQTNCISRFGN